MKRSSLLLAVGTLFLAACGPAEVIVTVELESDDGPRPVGDLEVQLIPYDRDVLFDELEAAYSVPEPEIPAAILEAQAEIAAAQQEWLSLQSAEATLRDSLRTIRAEMDQLPPNSGAYRLLFSDFNDVERRFNSASSRVEGAFDRFDSLQKASLAAADSIRVLRDNWAAEAFADYDSAELATLDAAGLDMVFDTTDASGVAYAQVKPGQYWVHARYKQAYSELYWNVPLEVVKGEPVTITLNMANAVERPIL